jgi:antitoxin FitA
LNLSIKNAPDALVDRLKRRAERNHRSLQGELMAIIEEAVRAEGPRAVFEELRASGLRSPGDSVEIIRADRDRDKGR